MDKKELKLVGIILVGAVVIALLMIPLRIFLQSLLGEMVGYVISTIMAVQVVLYLYKKLDSRYGTKTGEKVKK